MIKIDLFLIIFENFFILFDCFHLKCQNLFEMYSTKPKRTKYIILFYVKKAIQKFLEEEEEHEWAAAAYKDFLVSGEKTISHEEFLKRHSHLND